MTRLSRRDFIQSTVLQVTALAGGGMLIGTTLGPKVLAQQPQQQQAAALARRIYQNYSGWNGDAGLAQSRDRAEHQDHAVDADRGRVGSRLENREGGTGRPGCEVRQPEHGRQPRRVEQLDSNAADGRRRPADADYSCGAKVGRSRVGVLRLEWPCLPSLDGQITRLR